MSLRVACRQMVADRAIAKKTYGKGSIEEPLIKLFVNGSFGKIAQNVIEKHTWDGWNQEMDDIGCSSITSPERAALITDIVRCMLIGTMNQLSSENSVLKNELQKKSETIVTLNGQIGRLNESDLLLRQNEKLVKQNKELQQSARRSREEAEATVSSIKREYAARRQELDQQIQQAAQQERAARDMESNYRDNVSEEAKRITEKARATAEQEYRTKAAKAENRYKEQRNAVYAVTLGSLLYGALATLLTACNSNRFTADTSAFASGLWKMLTGPVWMALEACKAAWGVKDRIPYQGLDILAAGALVMIIFLLITGLIYVLTGYVVYEAAKFYHAEFWDLVSAVVALVSMGILVWFADALSFVSWNLILAWLFVHGIYVLIRMKISADRGYWPERRRAI